MMPCYAAICLRWQPAVSTSYPPAANIYLRDPSLCAVTSATIQQVSRGRFMLGIGVSHRPVLEAMGIEMGNARARLRDYTLALRKAFTGDMAKKFGVHFPHPTEPVPIYFGAVTLETVRMAGELADGLLLVHCTAQRLSQVIRTARESARQHGRRPDEVNVATAVQVYLHDDLRVARDAARDGMALTWDCPITIGCCATVVSKPRRRRERKPGPVEIPMRWPPQCRIGCWTPWCFTVPQAAVENSWPRWVKAALI